MQPSASNIEPAGIAAINALSADELARRLSGDGAVDLVREAAEAGSAEAQAYYGQMLLDAGQAEAGLGWFRAAAAQEHLQAINMVGRCNDLGWGTPVDKAAAARCYLIAARRGLDWGMYNYATLLTLGEGVAEDKAAALVWFQRAAALGNAKAINFVGSFYEDGWVVERDLATAAACYARAAAGGDFRGQFNHARMLADAGKPQEALPWLAKAAAGGNARFRAQVAGWLDRCGQPELAAAREFFAC